MMNFNLCKIRVQYSLLQSTANDCYLYSILLTGLRNALLSIVMAQSPWPGCKEESSPQQSTGASEHPYTPFLLPPLPFPTPKSSSFPHHPSSPNYLPPSPVPSSLQNTTLIPSLSTLSLFPTLHISITGISKRRKNNIQWPETLTFK